MTNDLSDIGLIGLAVMGQNLALNIADHGFPISVFNRTTSKTHNFISKYADLTPGTLQGFDTLEDFVESLARPRKIIILVQAGAATDATINKLIPLLDKDDIIIDGGNAHWLDTIRREKDLNAKGLRFVGAGVSGGEEGARFGPSLMPGGQESAYNDLKSIFEAIAAKVDPTTGQPLEGAFPGNPIQGGTTCCTYIGANGAGHYVKMVHNGIEYGDMQMICEAYHILRDILGLSAQELSDVFHKWNQGPLNSFLTEITADILSQTDPESGQPFVSQVLDAAGQKGTGKWTSTSALDMGAPAPTIAEAVFARCMSAIKEERVKASAILKGPQLTFSGDKDQLIQAVHDALYASKICSYAQGFQLMRYAQAEYDWFLNFGEIAQIWRGGCIIRAQFLQKITDAYEKNPQLDNLLLDDYFKDIIHGTQENWRHVVALSAQHGIPTPTFASALNYFDAYRTENLPQNLLQAQRDYFGAHTYERTDSPRGQFYHLDWPNPKRPQVAL